MHGATAIVVWNIVGYRDGIGVNFCIIVGTTAPERVHAHVMRDPMEPSGELNLSRFPGRGPRPESQKSFLRQIVGIVLVLTHPIDVRMDGAHVAIQKTRVRVLITRFHQFHKCFI